MPAIIEVCYDLQTDTIFSVAMVHSYVLKGNEMKNITYALDMDTGLTVSRIGSELACFILDYDAMLPGNNFTTTYYLDKLPVFSWPNWSALRWTKKIPKEVKNIHRKFWGFKELN